MMRATRKQLNKQLLNPRCESKPNSIRKFNVTTSLLSLSLVVEHDNYHVANLTPFAEPIDLNAEYCPLKSV